MARYYFSFHNGRSFEDVDGLELSDMAEVHAEAIGFARDLMRLEPLRRDWSRWVVRVTDDDQNSVFNLKGSKGSTAGLQSRLERAPSVRTTVVRLGGGSVMRRRQRDAFDLKLTEPSARIGLTDRGAHHSPSILSAKRQRSILISANQVIRGTSANIGI